MEKPSKAPDDGSSSSSNNQAGDAGRTAGSPPVPPAARSPVPFGQRVTANLDAGVEAAAGAKSSSNDSSKSNPATVSTSNAGQRPGFPNPPAGSGSAAGSGSGVGAGATSSAGPAGPSSTSAASFQPSHSRSSSSSNASPNPILAGFYGGHGMMPHQNPPVHQPGAHSPRPAAGLGSLNNRPSPPTGSASLTAPVVSRTAGGFGLTSPPKPASSGSASAAQSRQSTSSPFTGNGNPTAPRAASQNGKAASPATTAASLSANSSVVRDPSRSPLPPHVSGVANSQGSQAANAPGNQQRYGGVLGTTTPPAMGALLSPSASAASSPAPTPSITGAQGLSGKEGDKATNLPTARDHRLAATMPDRLTSDSPKPNHSPVGASSSVPSNLASSRPGGHTPATSSAVADSKDRTGSTGPSSASPASTPAPTPTVSSRTGDTSWRSLLERHGAFARDNAARQQQLQQQQQQQQRQAGSAPGSSMHTPSSTAAPRSVAPASGHPFARPFEPWGRHSPLNVSASSTARPQQQQLGASGTSVTDSAKRPGGSMSPPLAYGQTRASEAYRAGQAGSASPHSAPLPGANAGDANASSNANRSPKAPPRPASASLGGASGIPSMTFGERIALQQREQREREAALVALRTPSAASGPASDNAASEAARKRAASTSGSNPAGSSQLAANAGTSAQGHAKSPSLPASGHNHHLLSRPGYAGASAPSSPERAKAEQQGAGSSARHQGYGGFMFGAGRAGSPTNNVGAAAASFLYGVPGRSGAGAQGETKPSATTNGAAPAASPGHSRNPSFSGSQQQQQAPNSASQSIPGSYRAGPGHSRVNSLGKIPASGGASGASAPGPQGSSTPISRTQHTGLALQPPSSSVNQSVQQGQTQRPNWQSGANLHNQQHQQPQASSANHSAIQSIPPFSGGAGRKLQSPRVQSASQVAQQQVPQQQQQQHQQASQSQQGTAQQIASSAPGLKRKRSDLAETLTGGSHQQQQPQTQPARQAALPPHQQPHPEAVARGQAASVTQAQSQPTASNGHQPLSPRKRDAPLFTAEDVKGAALRPPLMSVRSDLVVRALHKISHHQSISSSTPHVPYVPPFLGRVVYDPFIEPAKLLDAQLLRNGIGGKVEIWLDTDWLEGEIWEAGAPSHPATSVPASPDMDALDGSDKGGRAKARHDKAAQAESTDMQIDGAEAYNRHRRSWKIDANDTSWTLWDLPPLRNRKIWGTDVYTDDSDILAACVHSGWLRLGSTAPLFGITASTASDKRKKRKSNPPVNHRALKITIVIAPKLIKYEGSLRAGVRSRCWGNSHDGVSYAIESVELVQNAHLRYSATRLKRYGSQYLPLAKEKCACSIGCECKERPPGAQPYPSITLGRALLRANQIS